MARRLVFVVLVILIGYGLYEALPILEGPRISLTSPINGQSFPGGIVPISGISRHTQDLTFNGAPLLIDQKGAFATTLVLPPGGAILTFTATDRFGKSQTVRRTIYVPN